MSKALDELIAAVKDEKEADRLYALVCAENVEHIRFHAAIAAKDDAAPPQDKAQAATLVVAADAAIAAGEADAGWWRAVVK